ncbi:hypothetical protein HMPREF1550_01299 [Actinomyces sp. oral taxon 877 str. F0543]|nr:hypothetical protein HMPREF1550_01299 [Actinomyces sp. oral taxon 877 str. F0543]
MERHLPRRERCRRGTVPALSVGPFANAGAVGGFVRRAAGSVCDCAILRSAAPLRASLRHLARGCTI